MFYLFFVAIVLKTPNQTKEGSTTGTRLARGAKKARAKRTPHARAVTSTAATQEPLTMAKVKTDCIPGMLSNTTALRLQNIEYTAECNQRYFDFSGDAKFVKNDQQPLCNTTV